MKKLLCGLLLFTRAAAAILTPVPLNPGDNRVDIDGNGKPDLVVLGQYDNNNVHCSHGLSFFILHPDDGYSMVPVTNSKHFVWLDDRLIATNAKVLVNRLFHDGERYYLVKAQKHGQNVYTRLPVKFTLYQFKKTPGEPGEPKYRWQTWRNFLSQRRYDSAEEAFAEIAAIDPNAIGERYSAPLPSSSW